MAVLLATMYTGATSMPTVRSASTTRFRTLSIWRPAPIVGALLGDTIYLIFPAWWSLSVWPWGSGPPAESAVRHSAWRW